MLLDFETISQGHIGLSSRPSERWPFPPAFFIFATSTEWEDFTAKYRFRGGTGDEIEVFHNISTDFDFDSNLLVLGLMHVEAICPRTDHRVLGAWQDGDSVYVRVAWEETWDVNLMSTGTMYVMASISRPEVESGQELSFTFISQWPPYYDGTVELVTTVTRSLP